MRQLLGQILSFPVRAVGGISLKVSPSFSSALIRGWVCAKTPASLGHCAGDGRKPDGGCVGGGAVCYS